MTGNRKKKPALESASVRQAFRDATRPRRHDSAPRRSCTITGGEKARHGLGNGLNGDFGLTRAGTGLAKATPRREVGMGQMKEFL